MRALKEEIVTSPSNLAMPVDFYHQALEASLKNLNELERKAIFLRFWECLPIARVADLMGFTWEHTDRVIDEALTKLRNEMCRLLEKRQQRISMCDY